jgi:hypothetical protein
MSLNIPGRRVGLALILALCCAPALAAPVTNADLIKLLEAGMPEEVVLQAIASGEPKFNTSSDALVLLKKKGATPAILKAVLAAPSGAAGQPKKVATAAPAPAAAPSVNPEEVVAVVNGQESTMQYLVPTMRTAARALGFGGVASYATLSGTTAARRLPASGVEFIVSVPKNAQVAGYVTLASFVTRKNGTREVSTGGGYMSYSTGINKDHVIPIKSEALADQSRARDGFVLYRVSATNALPSGEYALVLYTAEVRTVGFFAAGANSFFDFGVD